MTHTQVPGVAIKPAPLLTERQNERAVDIIESAERSEPYCLCGAHMVAVAEGNEIWLECSQRLTPRNGFGAMLSRLMAVGHTRTMIMELPTAG